MSFPFSPASSSSICSDDGLRAPVPSDATNSSQGITQSTASDLSSVRLPVWSRLRLPNEHATSSMSMGTGAVTHDLGLASWSNEPVTTAGDRIDHTTITAVDESNEFTAGDSGVHLLSSSLDHSQEVNRLNYVVSHLPSCIGDKELYKMFEPFGALQRATVIVGSESQSRGFGFVTFEEVADGEKAVAEMHGKVVQGATIRVLLSKHVYIPVVSKSVWVRNFPAYVTSNQLAKVFGTFGTLVSLHSQYKSSSSGMRRNKFQIVRVEYESVAIAQTVIDALHGVREVHGGLNEPLQLPLKLVVRFYSEKCDKPRAGVLSSGDLVSPTSTSSHRSPKGKSHASSVHTSVHTSHVATPSSMRAGAGAAQSRPDFPHNEAMSAPQAAAAMMPVSSPVLLAVSADGTPFQQHSPAGFMHGMDLAASPRHLTAFNAAPMMMSHAGPQAVQPQYYQTAVQAIPTPPQPQPQPHLVSYGGTVPPGMMQLAPMHQPVYTYLAYVGSPPQAPQMAMP